MAKSLPAVDQRQEEKEGEMDQVERERVLKEMKGDFEGWEPSLGEVSTCLLLMRVAFKLIEIYLTKVPHEQRGDGRCSRRHDGFYPLQI